MLLEIMISYGLMQSKLNFFLMYVSTFECMTHTELLQFLPFKQSIKEKQLYIYNHANNCYLLFINIAVTCNAQDYVGKSIYFSFALMDHYHIT